MAAHSQPDPSTSLCTISLCWICLYKSTQILCQYNYPKEKVKQCTVEHIHDCSIVLLSCYMIQWCASGTGIKIRKLRATKKNHGARSQLVEQDCMLQKVDMCADQARFGLGVTALVVIARTPGHPGGKFCRVSGSLHFDRLGRK